MLQKIMCLMLCTCLVLGLSTAFAESTGGDAVVLAEIDQVLNPDTATEAEHSLVNQVKDMAWYMQSIDVNRVTWARTLEGQRVMTVALTMFGDGTNDAHLLLAILDEEGNTLHTCHVVNAWWEAEQQAWEQQLGLPYLQWPLAQQYAFHMMTEQFFSNLPDDSTCLVSLDEAVQRAVEAVKKEYGTSITLSDGSWTVGRELIGTEGHAALRSDSVMWCIHLMGEGFYQVNISAIDGSVLLLTDGSGNG